MNRTIAIGLLAALPLLGCSHSAKYTVDEVALAQVPVAEKQPIFTAQNDVAVAKSELAKAQADADSTRREIGVAKAERDQARLEVDKTKMQADMAERSKDLGQQQSATLSRHVADLGARAAGDKVDMLDARLTWQKAILDQADDHIGAAMAKVELEKARLAVAKNIRPSKDFDASKFATEYDKRAREVDDSRVAADRKKEKYDQALARYDRERAEFEQARPQAGAIAH